MGVSRLHEREIMVILDMHDAGKSISAICYDTGRDPRTIRGVISKFDPKTRLAERLIKANAVVLATKVIEKSTAAEAIDVLTRPNIGVLQPITNRHAIGFFSSVDPSSLGGVVAEPRKVGEGVTNAAREGRQISDGATRSPLGIPEGSSGGGEEHEIGDDAYLGRVSEGPGSVEGSPEVSCFEFEPEQRRGPASVGRHGAQQPRRDAPGKGRKLHIVDPNPPKTAIKRAYRNPNAHGDSGIHLRYDIVEEPDA